MDLNFHSPFSLSHSLKPSLLLIHPHKTHPHPRTPVKLSLPRWIRRTEVGCTNASFIISIHCLRVRQMRRKGKAQLKKTQETQTTFFYFYFFASHTSLPRYSALSHDGYSSTNTQRVKIGYTKEKQTRGFLSFYHLPKEVFKTCLPTLKHGYFQLLDYIWTWL